MQEKIYNVLVSAVWQSESVVHMCTFFFRLFSIMVYHWILTMVLCFHFCSLPNAVSTQQPELLLKYRSGQVTLLLKHFNGISFY